MTPSMMDNTTHAERIAALRRWGFTVGARDPLINTNYTGDLMVAEGYEECEVPTKDGRNGPWCIVGNDICLLVKEAYDVWAPEYEKVE